MDANYNLLKLKLDMVYRNMPMEEAAKKYAEITQPVPVPPPMEEEPKRVPRKITVKGLIPKSKK